MHWVSLLLSALSVTWAKPRLPLLSLQMIDVVNESNTTWKVGGVRTFDLIVTRVSNK